jgi:hypothetical protein
LAIINLWRFSAGVAAWREAAAVGCVKFPDHTMVGQRVIRLAAPAAAPRGGISHTPCTA